MNFNKAALECKRWLNALISLIYLLTFKPVNAEKSHTLFNTVFLLQEGLWL